MFRLATSTPALVEAHVKAERARHELDASIAAAFARCEELEGGLRAFDRRLERSRKYLREAGYLDSDGFRPEFRRSRGKPGSSSGAIVRNRRHRSSNRRHRGRTIEITGRT
jgi:hypothetical protein